MTQAQLYTALKSLGMPVAYREFIDTPENPAPPLPFITYQFANDGDLKADNQNYLAISNFQVELYTAVKDPTREKLVQDKLKEMRLPYSKLEEWIDTEKMLQVIYQIQLIGG